MVVVAELLAVQPVTARCRISVICVLVVLLQRLICVYYCPMYFYLHYCNNQASALLHGAYMMTYHKRDRSKFVHVEMRELVAWSGACMIAHDCTVSRSMSAY
eukprot:6747-Heterococcus_DN1.PRE.2